MRSGLLCAVVVLLMTMNSTAGNEQLYGTWRLVSMVSTLVATGQTQQPYGKTPRGYINYGRDGRVMVLIVRDKRPKPTDLEKMSDQQRADLFRTMIAYAGTYTFDGKTVTHHLDISWNEIWTGTDQVRHAKFDGKRLILTTNPQQRSMDGKMAVTVLVWEKVE